MPNTYRKIYLQIVFAVKNRQALLLEPWRYEVFQYINGIVNNKNHYCLAVGGHFDHIHIFLDYNPNELIPNLVKDIKVSSNLLINQQKFTPFHFEWQNGYGVFSYSESSKDNVIKYILNQKQHHSNLTFKEEYLKRLDSFQIEFKTEYLFDFID